MVEGDRPEPQPNNTDYRFPDGWGTMTDEQKCRWFEEDRARRQAYRQGMKFYSVSVRKNNYRKK